jgi:hypothetical protein
MRANAPQPCACAARSAGRHRRCYLRGRRVMRPAALLRLAPARPARRCVSAAVCISNMKALQAGMGAPLRMRMLTRASWPDIEALLQRACSGETLDVT